MKHLILFVHVALFSYSAGANNVISFADFQGAKLCREIFRKAPEQPAQVQKLGEKPPPYVETRPFLEGMQDPLSNSSYFYYSAGAEPPMSRFDVGAWSRTPYLNNAREIFIIKADKIWSPGYKRDLRDDVISVRDLRQRYNFVSFTRFVVPEVFYLAYKVIYFVRGVETNLGSYFYTSPPLDYSPLFRAGPESQRLKDFIESWKIQYAEEQITKDLLLKLVETQGQKEEINAVLFAAKLAEELSLVYPEYVELLLGL